MLPTNALLDKLAARRFASRDALERDQLLHLMSYCGYDVPMSIIHRVADRIPYVPRWTHMPSYELALLDADGRAQIATHASVISEFHAEGLPRAIVDALLVKAAIGLLWHRYTDDRPELRRAVKLVLYSRLDVSDWILDEYVATILANQRAHEEG